MSKNPKLKPLAEKTGVTHVTGVTANSGGASNGNTAKSEGVSGVTVIDLNTAIDPVTTQPETLESQSPSLEQRPCYRCHTDFWQDGDGKAFGRVVARPQQRRKPATRGHLDLWGNAHYGDSTG